MEPESIIGGQFMIDSRKNKANPGVSGAGSTPGVTPATTISPEVDPEQIQTIEDLVRVVEVMLASSQPLF